MLFSLTVAFTSITCIRRMASLACSLERSLSSCKCRFPSTVAVTAAGEQPQTHAKHLQLCRWEGSSHNCPVSPHQGFACPRPAFHFEEPMPVSVPAAMAVGLHLPEK